MKAVFFFLYLAFGAGAAYGAHTYLAQDWMIAGGGGAVLGYVDAGSAGEKGRGSIQRSD